jgi:hypothetical protein
VVSTTSGKRLVGHHTDDQVPALGIRERGDIRQKFLALLVVATVGLTCVFDEQALGCLAGDEAGNLFFAYLADGNCQ